MQQTVAGSLYVFSAPSGAGKTSLVKSLLETTAGIKVSVSHTTRSQRPGEQNGVHYHFVNEMAFLQMQQNDEFLEHAKVFSNYYGTSRRVVEDMLQQGTDVILEIDWQGARQVSQIFPDTVGVFILPPSQDALRSRLQERGQDSAEVIQQRMDEAVSEMSHFGEFDYVVINDHFNQALEELRSIVLSHRLLTEKQRLKQGQLIQNLLN
ncbi:MAG: guanylate kinase [Gammaproteobacteria bacterium]|nr:guanylate kinase [Gammaproteobacteria bacterium]MDH5799555.1 guanylate kinase [Gammaproteobacteria bacterium]